MGSLVEEQGIEALHNYLPKTESQRVRLETFKHCVGEYLISRAKDTKRISSSDDVLEVFKDLLVLDHEEVHVLFLKRSMKIIGRSKVSEGGLFSATAPIDKLFREALVRRAASIIVCHNHPSGNLKPSQADKILCLKIKNAGKALDICVVDFCIVAGESIYSFSDESLLN